MSGPTTPDDWTMTPELRELLVRAVLGESGCSEQGVLSLRRILAVPDGSLGAERRNRARLLREAELAGREPFELWGDQYDLSVVTTIEFFGLEAHAASVDVARAALEQGRELYVDQDAHSECGFAWGYDCTRTSGTIRPHVCAVGVSAEGTTRHDHRCGCGEVR